MSAKAQTIPDEYFNELASKADIDWVAGLFGTGYTSGAQFLAEMFSKAVLDERERCADVCVARSKEHSASRHQWEDAESKNQCLEDAIEALACAAAIREGN